MDEGDILLGTDEILLKATAVTDDGRESVRVAIDKGLAEMAKKIAKYGTGGEMTVKLNFAQKQNIINQAIADELADFKAAMKDLPLLLVVENF